jgi:hypothetical protein
MKKLIFLTLAALLVMGGNGLFADATANVTLNVNLAAWYNLSIGAATVTFTDVAPTAGPSPPSTPIAGSPANVSVVAFAVCGSGQTLKLTVRAATDLTAPGPLTIGVDAITWTASGDSGYTGGTMTTAAPGAAAGSWSGTILHYHTGTFNYSFLRNYSTQAPGSYSATATYTLSAT